MQCAPGRSGIDFADCVDCARHRCAGACSCCGPAASNGLHRRVRAFGFARRVAPCRVGRHFSCPCFYPRDGCRRASLGPVRAMLQVQVLGGNGVPAAAKVQHADQCPGQVHCAHGLDSADHHDEGSCVIDLHLIALPPTRTAGCPSGQGGDDSPGVIVIGLHKPDRANPAPQKLAS